MRELLEGCEAFAITLVATLLLKWWLQLSGEIAFAAGLCLGALWMVWRSAGHRMGRLQAQIDKLYFYIKEPDILKRDEETNQRCVAVRTAILQQEMRRGMTIEEIQKVLAERGVSAYHLSGPDGKRDYEVSFFEGYLNTDTASVRLQFEDGKLKGWSAQNYKSFPAEIHMEFHQLQEASKR